MAQILMPKATAVWLVENTTLSFEQIAAFCGLHPLEVQGIADGEVAIGIIGTDPTSNGQLTADEIKRCEGDPAARLTQAKVNIPLPQIRTKGPRYTPVSKRQDKPDAVAWLVRHHPELSDAQVSKLIGTTKQTIAQVRDRTHWNTANLRPRDPVLLGLCTQTDLNAAILKARKAAGKPATLEPLVPPEPVHEEPAQQPTDGRPLQRVLRRQQELSAAHRLACPLFRLTGPPSLRAGDPIPSHRTWIAGHDADPGQGPSTRARHLAGNGEGGVLRWRFIIPNLPLDS